MRRRTRALPLLALVAVVAVVAVVATSGCGAGNGQRSSEPPPPPARDAARGPERLPLRYDRHLPSVSVRIDGYLDAQFAFATGIGINLISKSLCKMLSCVSAGHYVGKRMSGQEVTVPLAKVRSLAVGQEEQHDVVVGVIDIEGFFGAQDIQGFVSLGFFARRPFTLDERRRELVLEDAASLEDRVAGGVSVPVSVRREGESLTVLLPLDVAGQSVLAAVDTGSDVFILDEHFMAALGVDKAATKVVEGRDETGQLFTRWLTDLDAGVHPKGAPAIRRTGMRTMFQKIIHDGLVGRSFLEPGPSRSICRANGWCSRSTLHASPCPQFLTRDGGRERRRAL